MNDLFSQDSWCRIPNDIEWSFLTWFVTSDDSNSPNNKKNSISTFQTCTCSPTQHCEENISLMLQIPGTQLQLPLRAAKFLSGIPNSKPTWAIGLENATTILVSEKKMKLLQPPKKEIEMNMFVCLLLMSFFACIDVLILCLETFFSLAVFLFISYRWSHAENPPQRKVSHSPLPLLSGEFLFGSSWVKNGVVWLMGPEMRNNHLGWYKTL